MHFHPLKFLESILALLGFNLLCAQGLALPCWTPSEQQERWGKINTDSVEPVAGLVLTQMFIRRE